MAFKFLLIEDDDSIRELYLDEFKRSGFEIDGFATGKEGLASLGQKQYDVVLLDIMLPDTNGLEVLKQIKQNPASKNIKVVLLTNLAQDLIIKQGFELGAVGYLIKLSYNPEQVVEEVKRLLEDNSMSPQ